VIASDFRRRGRRRAMLATAALTAIAAGAWAPAAQGYVQYQIVTKAGVATGVLFHWNQSCIPVTVYPNDLTEMTTDEIEQAAANAAAAWSKAQISCTFLDIQVSASFEPTRPAGSDDYNVLVFRSPWCDVNQPELCQPEALAVTSVWAGMTSGRIHDGDIEVNTENVVWTDLVLHPAPGKQDLQNALTHEMGHLIGLDHDCYTPSVDPIHQKDQTGALVPYCLGADPVTAASTMFTNAAPGDLSKRTLADDDVRAACGIYPAAHPLACMPVADTSGGGGCSCSVDRSSPDAPLGSLVAALPLALGLAARARRRRRSSRASG
jgi:MYXO-CTERM domain-containing protein